MPRSIYLIFIAAVVGLLIPSHTIAQIYTKYDATGAGDGSSWGDAYTDLQTALASAAAGDEIWVARGTYSPASPPDRTATFQLPSGVALYGGFSGTEMSLSERDLLKYVTTLSGEVGAPGPADNCYHVMNGSGADSVVVDGFTITGGNADGSGDDSSGGGLRCFQGGSLTLRNITLSDNTADNGAGVFVREGATLKIVNVYCYANAARYGGGMSFVLCDSVQVVNSTIMFNTATLEGGALNLGYGVIDFVNTVLWRNDAPTDPQVRNLLATTTFVNSIVEGSGGSGTGWDAGLGIDGGGNIDADPLVVDASGGNPRLFVDSPAVDSGANSAAPLPATDIFGAPRIENGVVDIGAHEFTCATQSILYVDATATGNRDGTSWQDAFPGPNDAIAAACAGVDEIWVAAGTYTSTQGASREATFRLLDGVSWYGGFDGTETSRLQRDASANITVLSGEAGSPGNADNVYHVVASADSLTGVTVFDGFTVTGGNASLHEDAHWQGGGMLLTGSPIIHDVVVEGNSAETGGGIVISRGAPIISHVTIANNDATSEAGGIALWFSDAELSDVFVMDNTAVSNGGGILCEWSNVTIRDAVVSGNTSDRWGGGVMLSGHVDTGGLIERVTFIDNSTPSKGGAIMVNFDKATPWEITDCLFQGNSAGLGGGIYFRSAIGEVSNCVFELNSAEHGGAFGTSTVRTDYPADPMLTNLVIRNNTALHTGGGASMWRSEATLTNASFYGNAAADSGGAMLSDDGEPTLTNVIMWGNSSALGPELHASPSYMNQKPTVSHSLILGSGGSGAAWDTTMGIDGGGNIDDDPRYVDPVGGDLHVAYNSPAIDAGDNNAPGILATDLDGNPRIVGVAVDMGAYEFDPSTGVVTEDGAVPSTRSGVTRVYPNPFNPRVTIDYEVAERAVVDIAVYDVRGALVSRLVDDTRDPGAHTAHWDGKGARGNDVASGVYFLVFNAGNIREGRKLILLK